MSYTIKLTPKERIGLENVVAAQTGKSRDIRVYESILDKVETTPQYKRDYIRPVMGGGSDWDDDAIVLAELTPVDLETEECHKILDLLEDWPHFQVRDKAWRRPLRDKIKTAMDNIAAK